MKMNAQAIAAELKRQQLIKQCHCLIAAIAKRLGSIEVLRGIVPTLKTFAGYKAGRTRQCQMRALIQQKTGKLSAKPS